MRSLGCHIPRLISFPLKKQVSPGRSVQINERTIDMLPEMIEKVRHFIGSFFLVGNMENELSRPAITLVHMEEPPLK
jgi:hypothetical protein